MKYQYLKHRQSGLNQYPDLRSYDEIAIDLETRDPELKQEGQALLLV